LAKLDKSLYSKEEWKIIRERRRIEKQSEEAAKAVSSFEKKKYTLLCLKHGTKYSAEYVNRLYNMCSRNCTLDFDFVCITDDPKGIDKNVRTVPTPPGLAGWWCKPYIFSQDIPVTGTILYMDLDVVVASNIDKLFTYSPGQWCTVRDFTRAMRPKWHKYNSSVVRFEAGSLDFVWQEFKKDPVAIQRKFFGDQDYLYDITHRTRPALLYPDSWIQSWKWEVRKDKQFAPGGRKGTRKLKTIENVKPRIECCVCVFHGDPNPELCEDPWVVNNWR